MEHGVILLPSRDLWTPSARRMRARLEPARLLDDWRRPGGGWRPSGVDGRLWASGDTLAVFTPQANQPPSSNYAAFTVRNGHLVLAFDTTTQQTAIFAGVMPRSYAGGGITVYISWMAATATSGTIGWGVTFERDNDANHDLDSDAWATEQIVAAATVDATSGKAKTTNAVITAGAAGTDSIAAGEPFRIRIRRDVATDTATGDAQLLSVEIKET